MDVNICCGEVMQPIERFKEGEVIKQIVRCGFCGWKKTREVRESEML